MRSMRNACELGDGPLAPRGWPRYGECQETLPLESDSYAGRRLLWSKSSGWRGLKTQYPHELGDPSRCRRKRIDRDYMTGTGFRPVTPTWQWNLCAAAGFRQTNIGNSHAGCDL